MKKNWLRGLLLGVSLALLLGGGVALAQSVDAWPECFQCLPEGGGGGPYSYDWESCGWEPLTPLYYRHTFANGEYWDGGITALDGCIGGTVALPCEALPVEGQEPDVIAGNEWVWPDDYWGPYEICVSLPNTVHGQVSADQIVCDTILFAEDCEVLQEPEFVPEPSTIMLLASGLAGLAGYATLRWRTRE